jgi:hypothetical protein
MHAILGDLGHINFQITESYKMICLGGSGTFQFIYYYIYIYIYIFFSRGARLRKIHLDATANDGMTKEKEKKT